MTETQTITKQLATYEAKVNDTEHRHRRALQEIDFCSKERTRLEVLLELGETTQSELDAVDNRRQQAATERDETAAQLELSNRAQNELRERLEVAKASDRETAKRDALLSYKTHAEALLGLLEQAGTHYAALDKLWHKAGGSLLEGVGRAGRVATESWPDSLRKDLRRIDAQLQAHDDA